MTDITKNALSSFSKVSFNLNQEYIDLADSVAEMTGKSRTAIFLAFLGKGVDPLFNDMETIWKGLVFTGNLREEKKKKINIMLKKLEKIKKDWAITCKDMLS
ncbi:MAG: hypothetical protein AABX95_04860 [Nanoarchaeota archaeon]